MDDVFKKKLAELRSPIPAKSFGEDLLRPANWSLKPVPRPVEAKIIIREEYSEKTQVIESLGRFVEEKAKETETKTIKIDGGEIAFKPDSGWEDIPEAQDQAELMEFLTLDPEALQALIAPKAASQVQILFVTEAFNPDVSGERPGMQNELQYCFPTKTVEFAERMIGAMKIPLDQMVFYPIDNDGQDLGEEVMAVARYFKPSVIVTFGAKAANTILKRNDKLSLFQGQFFHRVVGDEDKFTIVPLYHPFILETNPNMKKLTWENMQKIMAHLKNQS